WPNPGPRPERSRTRAGLRLAKASGHSPPVSEESRCFQLIRRCSSDTSWRSAQPVPMTLQWRAESRACELRDVRPPATCRRPVRDVEEAGKPPPQLKIAKLTQTHVAIFNFAPGETRSARPQRPSLCSYCGAPDFVTPIRPFFPSRAFAIINPVGPASHAGPF